VQRAAHHPMTYFLAYLQHHFLCVGIFFHMYALHFDIAFAQKTKNFKALKGAFYGLFEARIFCSFLSNHDTLFLNFSESRAGQSSLALLRTDALRPTL
jgi:hypothetical protein